MIEVSQFILLILVEVLIGLLVLSGVVLFFYLRHKGRIRQAAHHLAERVQSDKPSRTERLKALLSDKYGFQGDELEQTLHAITQAEMRLFQNLINGYIKDDQVLLQQVDVDEENLVLAYQELQEGGASSSSIAETGDDSGAELVRLQEENQRLSDELRVTMDTMGRMLNEYSSMFSGGDEKPLTREAAEQAEEPPPEAAADEAAMADETLEIAPAAAGVDLAELLPDTLGELPDDSLGSGLDQASALDEEVSEIIDEVMEIADEMDRDEGGAEAVSEAPPGLAESLIDELDSVDIDVPEMVPAPQEDGSDNQAIPEPDLTSELESVSDAMPAFEPEEEPESQSDVPVEAEAELEPQPDVLAEAEPEPEFQPDVQPEAETEPEPQAEVPSDVEPEPEPGSLEEEWAKLLEEDAESKLDPSEK
jgi:hypothetical protein